MVSRIQVHIDQRDNILLRFGNQLEAVGEGKARVAMARAVNYGGRRAQVQVKRALVKQTSIPRAVINREVKSRAAKHQGKTAIEFVIYARGSELPLKDFAPKQFTFGVRAKVWGRMQRFEGAFMGPRPGTVAPALGGHVFHRTSSSRLPIEKSYGPSIPKEMVLGEAKEAFQKYAASETEKRLRHELGRMLTLS